MPCEPAHKEEYNGRFIAITYDSDPLNPRTEYDNAFTMICHHSRYDLGDAHSYNDPLDFLNSIYEEMTDAEDSAISVPKAMERFTSLPLYWLPLYLYDHSGITMNTTGFHSLWDSSQVGVIYIKQDDAHKEWVRQPMETDAEHMERILDAARAEVKTYDAYLTGAVYCLEIYATEADFDEDEAPLDTCGGWIGDLDGAINEARGMTNHVV